MPEALSVPRATRPVADPPPAARSAERSETTRYDRIKRAFDVAACLCGAPLVLPIVVASALAVRIENPGPAFYRGVRTGRGGGTFRIWKLRTMVVDAERLGGSTTARDDPRVTAVGSFLRRYKLDELPQVLNVLRGDMSLVGPRPEVPEYTDAYSPAERAILSVRPGITDLSSIVFADLTDRVGSTDADGAYRRRILRHKNRLRLRYVRERSMKLDLAILGRTALRLLAPKGRSA